MVSAYHITVRNFILFLALVCKCSQTSALLLAMWQLEIVLKVPPALRDSALAL